MSDLDDVIQDVSAPTIDPPVPQQIRLALGVRARGPRKGGSARSAAPGPVAALPVARVAVSLSLPHLDRPFDYLVPAEYGESAVPGARVRVRFAGQRVEGFVLERLAESGHDRTLAPLAAVVSAEPVLSPAIARLAREVADRGAGTLADVLRLAVPPRHARVEAQAWSQAVPATVEPAQDLAGGSWSRYAGGDSYLQALASGQAPRALWTALPGPTWPGEIADAVAATRASGRGVVVVVPDGRDLARVDSALGRRLGPGQHVALTADLGPAERYRRWLSVSRGVVRVVVGTRASAFAPVHDLGLLVCWDDGDELHAEPRAPYPHARDVLLLRAHSEGAAALIGGLLPSVEAVGLAESGWLTPLRASRERIRATAPRIRTAGEDSDLSRDAAARTARLPHLAFTTMREALIQGPVLVQVPRRGYLPALACARCRTPARCRACEGPLGRAGQSSALSCRWCGVPVASWACSRCDAHELRASVIGARRTAEELGRAFPGVPVITSGRDEIRLTIPSVPALVVATPGAEPVCEGAGYAAALFLDGWAMLGRADLRAAEDTLRRWIGAAALVRSGGLIVVLADPGVPAVQALLRYDPTGFALRELAERSALRFPPSVRMAAADGTAQAVADLLAAARLADLPAAADVLGPVPWTLRDGTVGERLLIRVPRESGRSLAASLSAAQRVRSASRGGASVRVELDPVRLV